jgi:hypothetical protein
MMLFKKNPKDPHDGFSVYNMTVRGVMPQPEYLATKAELEQQSGHKVSIVPIAGYNLAGEPLIDLSFAQIGGKVQQQGGNLFTDLAMSFTFQEWCEPDMAKLFMAKVGWTGVIKYKVTGLLTPFKAKITANWHRIQDHFKAQASVSCWFISSNISYETQHLIENGTIKVEITGGTPSQRDKVYALAKQIAERLFVRTISPNPLPSHPSGGLFGLSINYSKVEEDKTEVWSFEEHDFESRDLGMAIVVGSVPKEYFHGLNTPLSYSYKRAKTSGEHREPAFLRA